MGLLVAMFTLQGFCNIHVRLEFGARACGCTNMSMSKSQKVEQVVVFKKNRKNSPCVTFCACV